MAAEDLDKTWAALRAWQSTEDFAEDARKLALAVVDAVFATEGKGYAHGMGRWECDYEEVRARIEALR